MADLRNMSAEDIDKIDAALAVLDGHAKTIEHKPALEVIDVPPEGDTLAELEALEGEDHE